MTEQELGKFCSDFIKSLKEKELGCMAFLIDREGGAALTLIPDWSVLQFDREQGKIILDRKEGDTEAAWVERAMQTLYFLEAVKKNCEETGKLIEILASSLEKMVAKILSESNFESEPRVLH